MAVGLPIGVLYGIPYGLAFGMAAGVLIGFPYAVSITLPTPLHPHHTAVVSPGRNVAVAFSSGLLGGMLLHSVVVVFGKTTHSIALSMGLGFLYGVALYVRVSHSAAIVGGLLVAILFGVGFMQQRRLLGYFITGAAFATVFGYTSGIGFSQTPELMGSKAWIWGIVVWGTGLLAYWSCYVRLIAYPIQALYATGLYSYAHTRSGIRDKAELWKKFPVFWDKTIRLPLPFTEEFLYLLSKENYEVGIYEITSLIANRPFHQRYAQQALHRLIYDGMQVKSLEELAGVADELRWTEDTNVSSNVEQDFTNILRAMREVSSIVSEYFQAGNLTRRRRLLGQAHNRIEELRKSLSISDVPQLLNIADSWAKFINAAYVQEVPFEIDNPFIFGSSIRDLSSRVFVGRKDIVAQIQANVYKPDAHVQLFYGPRRTGKTTLLYQLARPLLDEDTLPVVIDWQAPNVTEGQASHLRYLVNVVEKMLMEKGVLQTPDLRDAPPEAFLSAPFDTISRWLERLAVNLGDRRLLICFDEYESLQDPRTGPWRQDILNMYRHLSQHHPSIVLLFAGANTFQEVGAEWVDTFVNAYQVRIGFLKPEDVRTLLQSPHPNFPLRYDPGVIEAIIEATHCQPYLVQAVGYEIVEHLVEAQRLTVTHGDVEVAITKSFTAGSVFYDLFWKNAREEGQAILRAIVRGETPPSHPHAYNWLCNNDVLNAQGKFYIPMFERWVRENQI